MGCQYAGDDDIIESWEVLLEVQDNEILLEVFDRCAEQTMADVHRTSGRLCEENKIGELK